MIPLRAKLLASVGRRPRSRGGAVADEGRRVITLKKWVSDIRPRSVGDSVMDSSNRNFLAIAIMASLVSHAAAAAQTIPTYVASVLVGEMKALIIEMKADITLEAYLQKASERFRYYDVDGDGRWTNADYDIWKSYNFSTARATGIAKIMAFDLNGDGVVTADEIRRKVAIGKHLGDGTATDRNGVDRTETFLADLKNADADGDGRATYPEFAAYFNVFLDRQEKQAILLRRSPLPPFGMWTQIPAFDSDGDGTVTLAEFQTLYTTLFRNADATHNGLVSLQEAGAYLSEVR
jgi:Ca2+-binding EF-hand superfamily protein